MIRDAVEVMEERKDGSTSVVGSKGEADNSFRSFISFHSCTTPSFRISSIRNIVSYLCHMSCRVVSCHVRRSRSVIAHGNGRSGAGRVELGMLRSLWRGLT